MSRDLNKEFVLLACSPLILVGVLAYPPLLLLFLAASLPYTFARESLADKLLYITLAAFIAYSFIF